MPASSTAPWASADTATPSAAVARAKPAPVSRSAMGPIRSAQRNQALRIGPIALRLAGAGFALATAAIGATVNAEAQLAVLLAGIVAMLAAERYARVRPAAAARA